MHVEDVLARGLAVRQEEVDALAPERGRAQRRGCQPTRLEHRRAVLRVELGERGGVRARDHERVPAHDRLDAALAEYKRRVASL